MKFKRIPKSIILILLPGLIFIGLIGWLISCASPDPKRKQTSIKNNNEPTIIVLTSCDKDDLH